MFIYRPKTFFFKGTIYQNITYGKKTTLKQCIEAAKLSNAHNFISKLPNKYNYKIESLDLAYQEDNFKE